MLLNHTTLPSRGFICPCIITLGISKGWSLITLFSMNDWLAFALALFIHCEVAYLSHHHSLPLQSLTHTKDVPN